VARCVDVRADVGRRPDPLGVDPVSVDVANRLELGAGSAAECGTSASNGWVSIQSAWDWSSVMVEGRDVGRET